MGITGKGGKLGLSLLASLAKGRCCVWTHSEKAVFPQGGRVEENTGGKRSAGTGALRGGGGTNGATLFFYLRRGEKRAIKRDENASYEKHNEKKKKRGTVLRYSFQRKKRGRSPNGALEQKKRTLCIFLGRCDRSKKGNLWPREQFTLESWRKVRAKAFVWGKEARRDNHTFFPVEKKRGHARADRVGGERFYCYRESEREGKGRRESEKKKREASSIRA